MIPTRTTGFRLLRPALKPLTLKQALCPAASLARFRKLKRQRATKQ